MKSICKARIPNSKFRSPLAVLLWLVGGASETLAISNARSISSANAGNREMYSAFWGVSRAAFRNWSSTDSSSQRRTLRPSSGDDCNRSSIRGRSPLSMPPQMRRKRNPNGLPNRKESDRWYCLHCETYRHQSGISLEAEPESCVRVAPPTLIRSCVGPFIADSLQLPFDASPNAAKFVGDFLRSIAFQCQGRDLAKTFVAKLRQSPAAFFGKHDN